MSLLTKSEVVALRDRVHKDSRAWDLLVGLTDHVGARFPGSPGEAAGVAWARESMRACGLRDVRTEPCVATLWSRGTELGEIIVPRRQRLVLSALGGSVGTPEGGIDAPIIEAPSLDALKALDRSEVEGKIVYLHHVMPRLRDGTGYNAASMVRMGAASIAAKLGAVACLVRSAGTDTSRGAHAGSLWYTSDAPQIPAAALSVPDAELLHRLVSAAGSVPVRIALSLGCKSLPDGASENVLAEIPGQELPDEIVLLGAHLDSWDEGTGALDDGAGCVVALEVARILSELPARPRRTIRVVLFANEELGVGGGRAYANAHRDESPRVVAAMEVDQGDGKPWALRVPEGQRDGALSRALESTLAPLGIVLDAGVSRGGVDIGPLRPHGVPFVDLRQDATRYFDFHHTPNDVIENVVRTDLDDTVAAFAVAIHAIAHAPDRFTR